MAMAIDRCTLLVTLEEMAMAELDKDEHSTVARGIELAIQAVISEPDIRGLSLNTLRDAIYEDAVAHGLWFERDDCPTTCVEMIQDEVSELDTAAMEWEDDICDNNDDFVEELADVIIMSLSVAGKLCIDIDAAVKRKMEINRERPWKHGKEDE